MFAMEPNRRMLNYGNKQCMEDTTPHFSYPNNSGQRSQPQRKYDRQTYGDVRTRGRSLPGNQEQETERDMHGSESDPEVYQSETIEWSEREFRPHGIDWQAPDHSGDSPYYSWEDEVQERSPVPDYSQQWRNRTNGRKRSDGRRNQSTNPDMGIFANRIIGMNRKRNRTGTGTRTITVGCTGCESTS